jgi:hypothetical protein
MFAEDVMCPIATHQFVNLIAVVCGFIILYIAIKQPMGWKKIFLTLFGLGNILIDGYYLLTWIFGG